jgi:hypothetical protein
VQILSSNHRTEKKKEKEKERKKMRSCWTRVGLKSKTSVLIGLGYLDTFTQRWWPCEWRQRLE